ncbi:hypothetical protein [uncultured Pseudoalteromonas sp.]|uniref:hypothetical protein n=1 Tax=uncultured Pseudoalteromonas sp. TaxID=114053 RepID=UPI0030F4CBED
MPIKIAKNVITLAVIEPLTVVIGFLIFIIKAKKNTNTITALKDEIKGLWLSQNQLLLSCRHKLSSKLINNIAPVMSNIGMRYLIFFVGKTLGKKANKIANPNAVKESCREITGIKLCVTTTLSKAPKNATTRKNWIKPKYNILAAD